MGKATDESSGITRLELLKATAVNNTGDDFSWIDELVEVDGRKAVQVIWVV